MDSREALVNALNNYEGAIVIVSHDPSMVERVADRLWLVHDGVCQDFDGDLEDYRKFTIQSRRNDRRQEREKEKKADTKPLASDKQQLSPNARAKKASEAEKLIARLGQEKTRLEQEMATPGFYNDAAKSRGVQEKYEKISKDLEEQEALWILERIGV